MRCHEYAGKFFAVSLAGKMEYNVVRLGRTPGYLGLRNSQSFPFTWMVWRAHR